MTNKQLIERAIAAGKIGFLPKAASREHRDRSRKRRAAWLAAGLTTEGKVRVNKQHPGAPRDKGHAAYMAYLRKHK